MIDFDTVASTHADCQRSRRRLLVPLLLAGALLGLTAQASGASTTTMALRAGRDASQLEGEWSTVKGTTVGAVGRTPGDPSGRGPQTDETEDKLLPGGPEIPFRLRVVKTSRGGLLGEWCGPKYCEPFAGVVRRDGSILMVDEDSTLAATRYGAQLEVCVTEPGVVQRFATCRMMKRR